MNTIKTSAVRGVKCNRRSKEMGQAKSKNGQLNKVRHDYLRYANCWEDADVLLEALRVKPSDQVLSIGSAGDNSFSLLLNRPERVVAVDINAVQLELIRLKKAAIQCLNHEDFLRFVGFAPCNDRRQLWVEVRKALSVSQQQFWVARFKSIESGLIDSGKFEGYFNLFSRRIMPLVHSKEICEQLFSPKSEADQRDFFDQIWNRPRWRGFFRLFFSKQLMGFLGRDPVFLKEVQVPVSTFILNQSAEHLQRAGCQNNYFLKKILLGAFGDQLPHYARKVNYEQIKEQLDRLHIVEGLAEDAFKKFGAFDAFNLSNIFEYMSLPVFKEVSQQLVSHGNPQARYAYWNLMVPRQMALIHSSLHDDTRRSERLRNQDMGFFYKGVICEQKV